MALPPKAIEQLAREPARTPGSLNRLLLFSSAVFLIVLFVYLGMRFGYRPYLGSERSKLTREIETFRQRIPASDQERLLAFASQITHLRTIFADYRATSRALTWLEDNTHQNVFFTGFDFDVARSAMRLGGEARTPDDVGAQLTAFRAQDAVAGIDFGGMRAGRTTWTFDVTVSLRDVVFRSP
ncbi:MAG: hypothetical protein HY436_00075 [Candidatus Liptonbacteria bacterium]|nr:hypothetical protein [Candidatus Liptonbacteria bacterium]